MFGVSVGASVSRGDEDVHAVGDGQGHHHRGRGSRRWREWETSEPGDGHGGGAAHGDDGADGERRAHAAQEHEEEQEHPDIHHRHDGEQVVDRDAHESVVHRRQAAQAHLELGLFGAQRIHHPAGGGGGFAHLHGILARQVEGDHDARRAAVFRHQATSEERLGERVRADVGAGLG